MGKTTTKPMSPAVQFFFSRIFPLVFVVIGAVALFLGMRGLVRAKASVGWPTAEGTILESSVESRRSRKHSGSGAGTTRTTYHAKILYEFKVEGVAFNGNAVAFGDVGAGNPSHARSIVSRYPKGQRVTVYYMPTNPDVCLLEPGIQAQAWFVPGIGLVFLAAGGGMAVFLPGAMRRQRAQGETTES